MIGKDNPENSNTLIFLIFLGCNGDCNDDCDADRDIDCDADRDVDCDADCDVDCDADCDVDCSDVDIVSAVSVNNNVFLDINQLNESRISYSYHFFHVLPWT